MRCPKCEIGTLAFVILKKTGRHATVCAFCDTMWLDGEILSYATGHPFDVMTQGKAVEYTVDDSETLDQDHRSAHYTHIK